MYLYIKLMFMPCISNYIETFHLTFIPIFDKQQRPWAVLSNGLLTCWPNYLQHNPWLPDRSLESQNEQGQRPEQGKYLWWVRCCPSGIWKVISVLTPWLFRMELWSAAVAVHETAGLLLGMCSQAPHGHNLCMRLLQIQSVFNLAQTRALAEVRHSRIPKEKQTGQGSK